MSILDRTDHCLAAQTCEQCDRVRGDLCVVTVQTALGVGCLTLCAGCEEAGRLPRWTAPQATRRALAHCGHLGIDADGMAALLDADQRGCDGCRDVGPLLTAPGTSGRSWRCGRCGEVWS